SEAMPQAQRQILIAVSGMFQPLYAFISAVAPAFPYIPESFNQCLFITHPLRSQILISSIFL
ncbi:hypothetical protein LDY73_26550, partial [Klebsiella pneumoniae]|uniref:hypothetical protein n=1 Tax=Klebsiella pneumoniae TaxID=573 RepID=UPI001CDD804C